MPHLNHTGPDSTGSKTGRKLGNCKLTSEEQNEKGTIGKGMGKARHTKLKSGKGKRLQYYLNENTINNEEDCNTSNEI